MSFRIYHNTKVLPRNKCEYYIVKWIKDILPAMNCETIEQAREEVIRQVDQFKYQVTVTELQIFSRYANKQHVVRRGFQIFGRGRGTLTISVSELGMRDSTKNYEHYDDHPTIEEER